jgi:hypothetical protein
MKIKMQTSNLVHTMFFYKITFIGYAVVKRLAARIPKVKTREQKSAKMPTGDQPLFHERTRVNIKPAETILPQWCNFSGY